MFAVRKRHHNDQPSDSPTKLDDKGQLIIFFSVSIILIVGIIAFVVNVGLFVKAKINLQNATDAAAWSGAAVQARQLTNIAYLNWEMRNTLKEWMFKYYVLGEISLPKTRPPAFSGAQNNKMDFRLDQFIPPNGRTATSADLFNVPSVCIHFAQTFNICKIFSVPGLPRFEAIGFPGLDETHNNFIDTIVKTKAKDCSKRTKFNFLASAAWAYGNGNGRLMEDTPQVATDRIGAWPQALELAIRIRNLEKLVNEPPHPQALCASGDGCTQINTLDQNGANELPINERKVKAFWSAYRSLGFSENDELKANLQLTEVPPRPLIVQDQSLSALLIPTTADKRKFYLDLILQVVNYSTFYSAFTARTDLENTNGAIENQGECSVAKVALPVPGYPLGYFKNPNVATYYAVKSETKFIGLFFPFTQTDGVTLKAYAAAKPFGGRIGPKLFDHNTQEVRPRDFKGKSAPYIGGIQTSGGNNVFQLGFPLPLTQSFWVGDAANPVGGIAQSNVRFGIPNLIYDVAPGLEQQEGGSSGKIQIIGQQPLGSPPTFNLGLYDKRQYELFANNLTATGIITGEDIQTAIAKVRAPTKYEALNYLIPTLGNLQQQPTPIDSPDLITPNTNPNNFNDPDIFEYSLFAPLFGPGTYYPNVQSIGALLDEYIQNNKNAVTTYLTSLFEIAKFIRSQNADNLYADAANSIHNGTSPDSLPDCNSVAGIFSFFYNSLPCPPPFDGNLRLKDSIIELWNSQGTGFASFYSSSYAKPQDANIPYMTAYMPGPRTGAQADGTVPHPFLNTQSFLSRRNYYSTKFVAVQSLLSNQNNSQIGGSFGMLGEGTTDSNNLTSVLFENSLEDSVLREFGELFF